MHNWIKIAQLYSGGMKMICLDASVVPPLRSIFVLWNIVCYTQSLYIYLPILEEEDGFWSAPSSVTDIEYPPWVW